MMRLDQIAYVFSNLKMLKTNGYPFAFDYHAIAIETCGRIVIRECCKKSFKRKKMLGQHILKQIYMFNQEREIIRYKNKHIN